MDKDKIEDVLQANLEECQSAVESLEEDESNSRESLSLAEYASALVLPSDSPHWPGVLRQKRKDGMS